MDTIDYLGGDGLCHINCIYYKKVVLVGLIHSIPIFLIRNLMGLGVIHSDVVLHLTNYVHHATKLYSLSIY